MSNKMFIPKGYRLLEADEKVRAGDIGVYKEDLYKSNPHQWTIDSWIAGCERQSGYYFKERHFRKIELTKRGNKIRS